MKSKNGLGEKAAATAAKGVGSVKALTCQNLVPTKGNKITKLPYYGGQDK